MLPSLATVLLAALLATAVQGIGKKPAAQRMGQIVDWTARHVLYPQGASLRTTALSQRDPRAYWNYLNLMRVANQGGFEPRPPWGRPRRRNRPRVDWSVSLGASGTAPNMYGAKYTFDVNAAPNCASDYVVFVLNTAPSATQANIAAFNNLYSGSSTTSCFPNTTATTLWAYIAGSAAIASSPILSLNGTLIAFVDNANPPVFHLLAPTGGQGTVGTPATPVPSGPDQQIINVTLTGGTGNSSSPFVDYFNNIAYVGTNNGLLFKINNVFTTPALASSPWPLTAGSGVLTGPVVDFGTGNIFVGSSDGKLYGFTSAGVAITGSPLSVGSGGANGGIVDPPVVDVVNGLIFVTTGEDSTLTKAVVAQTSTSSLATVNEAPIGVNNAAPMHSGAFNDAYFSVSTNMVGTTSEWFFYVCGVATGGGSNPMLYRAGFNGTPRQMNTSASAVFTLSNNNGEQCSPLTEFKNGVDRIFLGLMTSAQVEFFDISTSTTPTLGGTGSVAPVAEAGGTSAIIVDNVSAIAQASSIYFTTEASSASCGSNFCAVKLTQGGLQ